MARQLDPVIVTCALTGSIHTPSMSEHLPITPEEIVREGVEAADAGASILHVHVRDPETGEPTSDTDLFRTVAEGLKSETDAVIQVTTGGGQNQTVEERYSVVSELEPETASCNLGSMNFGLFHLAESVDEWEYEWEPEYLENSRGHVFPNTFETLEAGLETFRECGTMPELECYDVGHLYSAKHLLDAGVLEPPIHLQFVTGVLGGIAAEEEQFLHLVETADRLFGDDASWSVIGAGRKQFPFGTQAASMGGNARVGMEDNLYLSRGELAESNAAMVEKMVSLARDVAGRDPATPAEVREFFDLKGKDEVAF